MKQPIKPILVLLMILYCGNLCAQLQGQARIDSLVRELPKQKEDTGKVNLLTYISFMYANINPDEGIRYGLQELDLAKKIGWKKGICKADNVLGSLSKNKGDLPQALSYYLKSLKIAEEIGYKVGLASNTGNIGNIYAAQNDYAKALDYDLRSLKISEEIGDKVKIATSLGSIGSVYEALENHSRALEYDLQALKISEDLGNKTYIAIITGNIGNIYHNQNNIPEALAYDLKALSQCEEIGDKNGIARNMGNIGECYLEIARDSTGKIKANNLIPEGRQANLRKVIEYSNRAIILCEEIGYLEHLKSCYQCLSEAQALMGNYKEALKNYRQYTIIKDSVFSAENNKKIIQQGMNYEFDKKEAKAKADQEKKDAVAMKEAQRQKLVRNSFIGGFAVVLLFAGVFFSQRNRISKEKKISDNERKRSDELLLNILPGEVAEELKSKGSAEAKMIDQVTVLFTDFKGFTQLSEKLSPKALVAEINECFSAFDLIMQKYGVEKIKTIGDAYMAAGGLPTPNKTHPDDVVRAALDIQQYMHEHKLKKEAANELFFEIRIGVHTGPVVAGIVGVKKFQYDIWGDTVNTASRMESSGTVGQVNISGATYELVKDKFACEYRGEIDAKGKGMMKMYYVG